MSRSSLIALAALVLVAGVAAAVFATRAASVVSEPPTAVAATSPAAPAAPAAPVVAAPPPRPRAGRLLALADAMKELDLIRPSRQKVAEDFTLGLAGGRKFRLSEHRGKPVFINFWATWCPPCREEMPAMERLYRQHRDRLVMLAVSVDAEPAVIDPFVRQHGFTFGIGLDPKMSVAGAWGVRALPSTFIVDRAGNLVAMALGPRTWDNDASHSLVEGLLRER